MLEGGGVKELEREGGQGCGVCKRKLLGGSQATEGCAGVREQPCHTPAQAHLGCVVLGCCDKHGHVPG